jgi:hypothetical protein
MGLAQAAQDHNRIAPRVLTRIEQWVGEAVSLQNNLARLRNRLATEQATLQELEHRGARSLLNPFGVSAECLHNARYHLDTTRGMVERTNQAISELLARHATRQQEETAHRAWLSKPQSQGAQHIAELLRQPQLKAHHDSVKRTFEQLQQWQQAAESLEFGPMKIDRIREAKQDYLDGHGLSEPAWQQMQHDLELVQARQRQWKRQQQIEM